MPYCQNLFFHVEDSVILIVATGDAKIDNAKYKATFHACASSNSAIEMTMEDLEKYSKFDAWVDVCKPA